MKTTAELERMSRPLAEVDPDVYQAILHEAERQHSQLELIASENFVSEAVLEAARQCCDAAAALLKPQGPDYIWDDLQELKARILRRGPVETVLREWSQGLVGDKTFQQITEDFAHIIIPKVWEREERKVSRVAARLSISPKKVRRILRAAGLLG